MIDKSIAELHELLKTRKVTAVELVEAYYKQIDTFEPKLNSFITLRDKADVLNEAQALDKAGDFSNPLTGIPFVLKDSYLTKGIRTTASSKILEDYMPQYNATVYQKLLDAKALLIGKMAMDAWGHGASSENTDFEIVKNPYDLERSAGGSTGGPAAAIAARMTSFGIGEDTGGSIRNPAAWNNITGLKVTYGRVSRYGCIAYASSFDTVGPMAKTAEDCAYVLQATAGKDPYDGTTSPTPVDDYVAALSKPIEKLTIGIPSALLGEGLDPEIKEAILAAKKEFETLNCNFVELEMPMLEFGLAVYYLIGPSETSSNLGRYDGVRYGAGRENFTEESMRRIMMGTYALSAGYYDAYYRKGLQGRTLLIKEYKKAFDQVDVLLMPVTPIVPPKIGQFTDDPITNMLADIYTVTHNPAGIPSLALPCGFTKSGLPIGMQLAGPMWSEAKLLNLGHQYQQVTDWHKQKPKLISGE